MILYTIFKPIFIKEDQNGLPSEILLQSINDENKGVHLTFDENQNCSIKNLNYNVNKETKFEFDWEENKFENKITHQMIIDGISEDDFVKLVNY